MRKRTYAWLGWMLAIVGLTRVVPAQERSEVARAEPARAPTDLAALLEPIRAKHDVPALGGAYVKGAELIGIGAVGLRARGSEAKVTVDDLWHLGSCTKAMTATLAAKLVEQDKLEWSTTVGEVFSEWKETLHADWREVPIEWLLQNRGGASKEPPKKLWSELWKRSDPPHEARRWFVEQLLREAPVEEPGTKFVYSNQGFTIAGAMLEKLTKKAWEELVQAELFEPLGMKSAGFGPPGSFDVVDQPRGHTLIGALPPGPLADNPPAIGPAGTVHCTLGDWAKFASAHLRGENGVASILEPDSFRKLHSAPEGQAYAMGWVREPRPWAGGDVVWHNGSNTMWYCVVWIAPAKDHAFLATTNIGQDKGAKACDDAIVAMLKHAKLLE